ncbi:DUF1284 domain-containing protein [Carboxydothermus ferrireducens]|uniref:DUF1284 domain-containing protein n=1 Tax=Carboxydothermus ferrireducens DSM 11255 TaxID=1119529 RepID=A0ABX2RB51_9THEO|nr:DUF1284 domain-containing protein [Carboxydothermus ferrireducens]NYE58399.1 hypothetical protein [Carboxydothermus ferrireducens DSM 11255]
MVKLRPHHLLCFLGFRGLGYNDHFTQNFSQIRTKILKSPELLLELETQPDDICKNCPELINGLCRSNDKVSKKDVFLITFFNTKAIAVEDAYKKIKALEERKFNALCQDCEWYPLGFCLEGFRKLKSTSLFP